MPKKIEKNLKLNKNHKSEYKTSNLGKEPLLKSPKATDENPIGKKKGEKLPKIQFNIGFILGTLCRTKP